MPLVWDRMSQPNKQWRVIFKVRYATPRALCEDTIFSRLVFVQRTVCTCLNLMAFFFFFLSPFISPPPRRRRSPQALTLLDQLLKFGAERCIDEAKERIYQIKSLCDFQYSDENTMKDCGTGSASQLCAVSCFMCFAHRGDIFRCRSPLGELSFTLSAHFVLTFLSVRPLQFAKRRVWCLRF